MALCFTCLPVDAVSWQLLVDYIKKLCRDFLRMWTAAELRSQVAGYRFLLNLNHGQAKCNCHSACPIGSRKPPLLAGAVLLTLGA